MKRGKRTCEILKDVRRKVAQENGIPLVERECTHEGDCRGTCPYCESEVRYLERELSKRRALGKAVTVAGIAVSSMMMGACHSPKTPAPAAGNEPEPAVEAAAQQVSEEADGQDVPPPPGQSDPYELDGIVEEVGEIAEPNDNSSESAPNRCSQKAAQLSNKDGWDGDFWMGDVEVVETEGLVVEVDEMSDSEDSPFKFVEEMPEFPGGADSLKAFLAREIQYPPVAKNNGITGTVLIEFVVEKDGQVTNAKVKVPLFPECDMEAVQCVMSMPKWKPGRNMGKPVRCYFQIPITFRN
jgi:TonB family protein